MTRLFRLLTAVLLTSTVLLAGPPAAMAQSGADVAASITSDGLVGKHGRPMTFTITATNVGDAAATDVTINGWMPDWFNYVSHSCQNGAPADWGYQCIVGDLAPGETATMTLVVDPVVAIKGDKHVYEGAWVTAANDVNPANDEAQVKVLIASYCHKAQQEVCWSS